jgi:hypothetical protein
LSGIQGELDRLGVGLVVVGSGNAAQARDFLAERRLTLPLYVDPGLSAYRALGLKRGVGATLNLSAIKHGARAMAGGFTQGAVAGDPWQQGGVFLVRPDGTMPYAYRSEAAGDHPDPRAIVEAARAAATP